MMYSATPASPSSAEASSDLTSSSAGSAGAIYLKLGHTWPYPKTIDEEGSPPPAFISALSRFPRRPARTFAALTFGACATPCWADVRSCVLWSSRITDATRMQQGYPFTPDHQLAPSPSPLGLFTRGYRLRHHPGGVQRKPREGCPNEAAGLEGRRHLLAQHVLRRGQAPLVPGSQCAAGEGIRRRRPNGGRRIAVLELRGPVVAAAHRRRGGADHRRGGARLPHPAVDDRPLRGVPGGVARCRPV